MALTEQTINIRLQPPNQQANKTTAPVGQIERLVNGIVKKFTREGVESLRVDKREAFGPYRSNMRDPVTGMSITAGTFSPTDIPGCRLWLRGDRGITLAGGLVSAWADQSGNGNHAAQATGAKQPAYSASAIGAKPGLVFDGSNDFMAGASLIVPNGSPRTIFIVCEAANTTGGTLLVNGASPTLTVNEVALELQVAGTYYVVSSGVGNGTIPAYTINGGQYVFEQSWPGGSGTPGQFLNGIAATVTNSSIAAGTGAAGYSIGIREDGITQPYPGKICEIIVYNTTLGGSDVGKVRGYLASRYGLSVAGGTAIAAGTFPQPPALFSSLNREALVMSYAQPHVLAEGSDYVEGDEWKQHQTIVPTRALTTRNVYTDNLQADKPDGARDAASGAICYVWRELHKARCMIVDDDGTAIRLPFDIATDSAANVGDAGGIRCKVAACNGNFWVFYSSGVAGDGVKASVFTADGETLLTGIVISIGGQLIESVGYSPWDILSTTVGGVPCVLWGGAVQFLTGTIIKTCTIAGLIASVVDHQQISVLSIYGFAWLASEDNLWHYAASSDSSDLRAIQFNSSYVVTRNHLVANAASLGSLYVNFAGHIDSDGNEVIFVGNLGNSANTLPLQNSTKCYTTAPDGTVFLNGIVLKGTVPVSRTFKMDTRWYYVAYYASIGTAAYTPLAVYLGQPTFFLVNAETRQYCGRWEYGSAAGDYMNRVFSGGWHLTSPFVGLPMTKQSAPAHIALSYRAMNINRLGPESGEVGFKERRIINTLGVRDFVFGAHGQTVEHFGELLIPGPEAVSFTGATFTEHGIALAPEQPILNLTVVGTPFLTLGQTYSYVFCAEATDNKGDRVWSQTTLPVSIPVGGGSFGVSIVGRYVRCTRRTNVHISVYRNILDKGVMTTEHFKITDDLAPIINNPEGDTWNFVDNVSDLQASLGEVCRTDDGFVQSEPCPAFSHGCTYDDRAIVIGYDGALWFSGQKTEGEALWFNSDTHRLRLPTNDQPLRIENMDGRIVIFCDKSKWHLPDGGFPGPDGFNGNLKRPERIDETDGCTGVTQKLKSGIAYSSTAGGLWLLTRGLEGQQASSQAIDEFGNTEILSMCVDKDQRLFVTMASAGDDGQTLVFDQISGVWSVFTHPSSNALLGTTLRGQYAFVTGSYAFRQRPGVYMDTVIPSGPLVWYEFSVSVRGLLAGVIKGLARIWKFLISGERLAPCVIDVAAEYETEDLPVTEAWTFRPDVAEPFEYQFEPQQEEMTALNLTISDATPAPTEAALPGAPSFGVELISLTAGIERGLARVPGVRVPLST